MIDFQVPSIRRKQIGAMTVTLLSDGHLDSSFELLSGIGHDDAKSNLERRAVRPVPRMNINAYVVQNGSQTILIDSGAGGMNEWGGRLQVALAAAGIDSEQIDTILLTHAHPDHIGGLAGPSAEPLFKNVQRLFVHRDELAFWTDEHIHAGAPDASKPYFDLARNVFSTYRGRVVPFHREDLLSGIQAVPLPGHTPGHTGFLLDDQNDSLLIWGDIVHFPHIQIEQPQVTIAFDNDPVRAASTRERLLDRVVSEGLTVTGMHFDAPTTGQIVREGSSYRLRYDV